jgi:hypothetical protein
MKSTTWGVILATTAVGLAVGWVLVDAVGRMSGRIMGVPWLAPGALWVLAIGVVGWAVLSRGRIGHRPRGQTAADTGKPHESRMPPLVAARTAALALAASRTGALIGGFYLGIALGLLGVRDTPSGSAALGAATACVAACVVLVAAALWLEHLCRLDDGPDRP